jgi:hypothetical protein
VRDTPSNTYQAPARQLETPPLFAPEGGAEYFWRASRRLTVLQLRFRACGAERALHPTLIEALPPRAPKREGLGVGRGVCVFRAILIADSGRT